MTSVIDHTPFIRACSGVTGDGRMKMVTLRNISEQELHVSTHTCSGLAIGPASGLGEVCSTHWFKDLDFLQLSSSLLDPHGPFELCSALRGLPAGAEHKLLLQFSPQAGGKVGLG